MAFGLYFFILLLWTFQCKAGSLNVQDESLIRIGFGNEPIITNCTATMACKPEYADFEIYYYRIDQEGNKITVQHKLYTQQIPSGCNVNRTWTKNYRLRIEPIDHTSVTGTYYCEVKWKSSTVRGNGTFILFRDRGYIEPSDTLQMILITIIIILAILTIVGTILLLWKRKMVWPWKSRVKKCPDQNPVTQHASSHLELPDPMYTDLEPHPSHIYLTFEKNANSPSHKKMPIAKMCQQETQGGIQDIYENNITDLYENI
uniref:NFAT activation molecule 1 n=1 Tax=Pogona vitticeps TaxID=103695 RepID=A0A6J0T4Y0_9SAUR